MAAVGFSRHRRCVFSAPGLFDCLQFLPVRRTLLLWASSRSVVIGTVATVRHTHMEKCNRGVVVLQDSQSGWLTPACADVHSVCILACLPSQGSATALHAAFVDDVVFHSMSMVWPCCVGLATTSRLSLNVVRGAVRFWDCGKLCGSSKVSVLVVCPAYVKACSA